MCARGKKYLFKQIKQLSIYHIAILCFIIVGVIPLLLLGWKNIQHENDDIHREVKEKHQLLAQNLTFSIGTYLEQAMNDANSLANKYDSVVPREIEVTELNLYPKFLNIAVIKENAAIAYQSIYKSDQDISQVLLPKVDCISKASIRQRAHFSSLITSPFSNKPTLFICQPLENKNTLLLAELDLSHFYALQKSIVFGRRGHAAIVNQFGQVVAHPNQNWVDEIKDISDWKIIQTTNAGKTGTMSFYSDHFKEEMISGFASVPNYRWGVIIPQPMSEINEQIQDVTDTHFIWSIVAFLLSLLLAAFFTRKISSPIVSLSQEVAFLEANNFQGDLQKQASHMPKELAVLSNSFRKVLHSFQKSNANLKDVNKSLSEEVNKATNDLLAANIKLQRVVTLDELTGLYNRRGLQDILVHEVARVKRDGGSFSILLCDLDHFKLINDNYGHATGDNVLRTFSNLAQSILRERDVVGRWGGEEFLCILGDADYNTTIEVAERLRNLVADTVILPDEIGFNVTVSIGLATFPTDGEDIQELLACADNALYDAKQTGRNKTVTCKRSQSGFFSIANQLRCALSDNAIKVAFQSMFDVATSRQTAKRAMSRIICDKEKILKANVFLPTAKQFKLMSHIDRICFDAMLVKITENDSEIFILSVSREFLEKTSNLDEVVKQIQNYKSSTIIFEISESEFAGNVYEAKKTLSPYIDAGVQLCLNEFCSSSGVSLEFLTELPFHYVKVNDDLLNNCYKNNRTMLAMRSALRMCKSLGIKTIASNVSTQQQKQIVEQLRFDWAQGYMYEKPVLNLAKNKTIYV